MTRTPRTSAAVQIPNLAKVFDALSDESRLGIVRLLLDGELRTAGQIAESLSLPASTCSYHLSRLLNVGITVCRSEGTHRFPVLRRAELDELLPGLLDLVERGAPDDRA